MKKYKIIFSPTFVKMVEKELKYYISYSYSYAIKLEKKIYEAINFIKLFPYATSTIKFRGDPEIYRKFVIMHRFIIVFKTLDTTIHIDYFIDGRQSPKNYFKLYKN